MAMQILTNNPTVEISERLKCKVTSFDTPLSLDSGTRFILMSGLVKQQDLALTGVFAAVTTGAIDLVGEGVVIETPGYAALEEKFCRFTPGTVGQLSYIDGCSNTNLVDPPRNGDPCINYLYFPAGIQQTYHTHPSIRIGYVLSGSGMASVDGEEIQLSRGTRFILDRHSKHRFSTSASSSMSLMVFHPDSESGPTDEFNPMKSRTYMQR